MSNSDIGTLYVLANRDNSLAKIGLTRNGTPDIRAEDYAREHSIRWRVYWSGIPCNVAEAEAKARREVTSHRFAQTPGSGEILHVTPSKAKYVAEKCVVAPKTEAQLAYERAERERRRREAEAAEAAAKREAAQRAAEREAAQKAEASRIAQIEWERKTWWSK